MVCASLFFIEDPRQMAILEQVSLPHSLRTLRRRRLYRVANPQFWWYTCTNARHWQTSAQKEHAVQKSPEAKHPTHAIEQNRRQRPRRRDAHLLKVLHCLRFIVFFIEDLRQIMIIEQITLPPPLRTAPRPANPPSSPRPSLPLHSDPRALSASSAIGSRSCPSRRAPPSPSPTSSPQSSPSS